MGTKKSNLPPRVAEQRVQVVDAILNAIERDGLRWVEPFVRVAGPRNAVSGHEYHGSNRTNLAALCMRRAWSDPRFVTYKQARESGHPVRKGAKSVAVEKWTMFPRDKDDPDSPLIPRCVGHYNVFNIADTEGAWPIDDVVTPMPVSELTQAADRLIASSRCEVREDNTGGAYYSPRLDLIHMPCRDRFEDAEFFVRTLLHEMTHSTAPAVGRIVETGGYGSEGYAREELVAELGAMFAMNATGIRAALDERDPYWEQHAAYLQSWTRMLTDKPNALYQAASAAERACDYIVGRYNETAAPTNATTKEAA